LNDLLEQLTRKAYMYWFITKDFIKHTNEEMHRMRDGRKGAELPHPLWAPQPPDTSMCSATQKKILSSHRQD
jgi:hypothetical protein